MRIHNHKYLYIKINKVFIFSSQKKRKKKLHPYFPLKIQPATLSNSFHLSVKRFVYFFTKTKKKKLFLGQKKKCRSVLKTNFFQYKKYFLVLNFRNNSKMQTLVKKYLKFKYNMTKRFLILFFLLPHIYKCFCCRKKKKNRTRKSLCIYLWLLEV